MTYFVNLVQRGISANTHPVSGKSGKGYGTAVNSPQHGGVIFRMSLQDYMNAADDLCGNTVAGQQWVPEFVPEAGAQAKARPKCDRCPKQSVAIWDRFHYCAEHAPNNATWYDEGERPASAPAPTPAENAPDVLSRVEEPVSPGVSSSPKEQELPRETLPPPFMGSDEETTGGTSQPPPAVASERVEPVAQPASAASDTRPAVAVVQAITEGVIKAVMPQIEQRFKQMAESLRKPAPRRKSAKPVTEFRLLQDRARDLGMNTFGKNKAALEAFIKEKGSEAT